MKSFDLGVVVETSLKQGKIKESASNGAFVVHFDDEQFKFHGERKMLNLELDNCAILRGQIWI